MDASSFGSPLPADPRRTNRSVAYRSSVLFDVRTQRGASSTVVRVVGDVDLANLPALKQEVDAVRDGDLVLDLDAVTLWDPVAFGVVVAAALRTRRRDDRFAVVLGPGRARDVFAESGIDRIVEVRAPD